jgi:glucose uptake protein GlcU
MSVKATYHLGIKIGFPLTQTCILITALWGISYFKEFDLLRSGYGVRFGSGICSVLLGAYLLGSTRDS